MAFDDEKLDISIFLKQWQTCVDLADRFSKRRDTANNLFVTLNTAIIAGIGVITGIVSMFLSIVGFVISIIWLLDNRYYRQISIAKYTVICDLETLLPASPLTKEWEICKNNKHFFEATHIEALLIFSFISIYLFVIVISLSGARLW